LICNNLDPDNLALNILKASVTGKITIKKGFKKIFALKKAMNELRAMELDTQSNSEAAKKEEIVMAY
jgi:hypothetical protein